MKDIKYNKATINIKIPIEINGYVRKFIFDNINEYRDIRNDFIHNANEYKDKYGTYEGYNPLSFHTKYFKHEKEIGRYKDHCIGLSEQASREILTSIKSIRSHYRKAVKAEDHKHDDEKTAEEGTLHFKSFNKFYGSFKVHNKSDMKKCNKNPNLTSRIKVTDRYNLVFRSRGKYNGYEPEYIDIRLKEPLYDDIVYHKKGNHEFTRYYKEGPIKHECRFNAIDIKETCFIHELDIFYIQLTVKVHYVFNIDEIESRLPKAGIDTGIHNPLVLYDGNTYKIIRMDDKTCRKLHYLERRAKRLQSIMNNKLRINKERVEQGLMKNKYSNNYEKVRKKYRRTMKRIRNIRRHWRYEISKMIVTNYKTIVVDTFTQPINTNTRLPKRLKRKINYTNRFHAMCLANDVLKHMANKYGCEYIEAPSNTTRTCSCCGYKNKHLPLSQRNLVCKKCGEFTDRDMNAAKNCYLYG